MIRKTALVVLILCSIDSLSASYNTPLNGSAYQKIVGAGFATNYFKTLDFSKYDIQNLKDIKAKGFKNLRLRCRADIGYDMTTFLTNLETVVDDCLSEDVIPIISWVHHKAEAYGTEEQKKDYVSWWKQVATKLKDKDYRLSFNLFTELGVDYCNGHNIDPCPAIALDANKYNNWTEAVKTAIRNSGGKNDKRILILASPKKTGKYLKKINKSIYQNDNYLMVEWHQYASGPNKKAGGAKEWIGDGTVVGRENVDIALKEGVEWSATEKVPSYFAAWMPQDNKDGSLNQTEAIFFLRYFIKKLSPMPWSLNVLDVYYDTSAKAWRKEIQDIKGTSLDMFTILEKIINVMPHRDNL